MRGSIPERHQGNHRQDIDGLRAIAVAAVIINHINENWLPLGNLGVDIFFVISGYVITLSLIKRTDQRLGPFLIDFYGRRIKRLYPALIACVIITSLAVICLEPRPYDSLNTGKMALAGLSNIYLYNIGTNYIADSARENAFLQTWSLGVEEQFYFIAPLVLWMTLRIRARKSISYAIAVFTLLSSLSLILYYSNTKTDFWAAFFLMPSRFWELGIGVLTFLIIIKLSAQTTPLFKAASKRLAWAKQSIQSLALIALILVMFVTPDKSAPATIAVVTLTSIFIGAGSFTQSRSNILTHPLIQWLGLTSYSLYLWHWSALYVWRKAGIPLTPIATLIIILLMLLLACASYYCIENPCRLTSWAASPQQTLLKGFGLISGAIAFAAALQWFLLEWYPVQHKSFLKSRNWIGRSSSSCHVETVNASTVSRLISKCLTSSKSGPKAFVIGNSHAQQYLPTIKTALPNWNLLSLTMWGCSYIPESKMNQHEIAIKGCHRYGQSLREFFAARLAKHDLVFLAYIVNDDLINPPFRRHITDLAQVIKSKGAHLVVFDDIYAVNIQPEDCQTTVPMMLGLKKFAQACSFQSESAPNHQALRAFDATMDELQREGLITYVKLRDFICPSQECHYKQPDGGFTFDIDNHLYHDAAVRMAPMLRHQLDKNKLLPSAN